MTEFAVGFSRPVWQQRWPTQDDCRRQRALSAWLRLQQTSHRARIGRGRRRRRGHREGCVRRERACKSSDVTVDARRDLQHADYRVGVTLANLDGAGVRVRRDRRATARARRGDAQYNCFTRRVLRRSASRFNETWTLETPRDARRRAAVRRRRGQLVCERRSQRGARSGRRSESRSRTLRSATRRKARWLPDVRVGYRKNLAGTKLSSASLGFTFFGAVHFDVACGLNPPRSTAARCRRHLGAQPRLRDELTGRV